MTWQQLLHASACVVVPIAWGLIIVWLSNRIDRRFFGSRRGHRKQPRPIEYHI